MNGKVMIAAVIALLIGYFVGVKWPQMGQKVGL